MRVNFSNGEVMDTLPIGGVSNSKFVERSDLSITLFVFDTYSVIV